MAKFIKSIFQPSEKRKTRYEEGEEERGEHMPPLDGRRKLSISRSGRLKQANKKRHSLSLDLYGSDLQTADKPKTVEYHVKNTERTRNSKLENQRRSSADAKPTDLDKNNKNSQVIPEPVENKRRKSQEVKTPEEEIDIAFQIIDKS